MSPKEDQRGDLDALPDTSFRTVQEGVDRSQSPSRRYLIAWLVALMILEAMAVAVLIVSDDPFLVFLEIVTAVIIAVFLIKEIIRSSGGKRM